MRPTALAHARLLALTFLLTAPVATVAAQAADPVLGTWQLDVAKSTYSPGPAAKSQTRTYSAAPNGFTFAATGVDGAGKPVSTNFTVAFDGKFVPVTGNPAIDEISVKRIDANTVEATQKKGGKVVAHVTRTVSKDGKTPTSTTTGTNASGKPYKNVEIFSRK